MTPAERESLIARYRAGHGVVAAALAGATEADLDRRPPDGTWSAREVAHHLADSEMTSAIRLRRLIAEESPEIVGYDEELFAKTLFYGSRPVNASLAALKAARETTAEILDCLDEAQWNRAGMHSESGAYSVETWLEIYGAHAHDHAAQMLRAMGRE
jgi:hypothetical protein